MFVDKNFLLERIFNNKLNYNNKITFFYFWNTRRQYLVLILIAIYFLHILTSSKFIIKITLTRTV